MSPHSRKTFNRITKFLVFSLDCGHNFNRYFWYHLIWWSCDLNGSLPLWIIGQKSTIPWDWRQRSGRKIRFFLSPMDYNIHRRIPARGRWWRHWPLVIVRQNSWSWWRNKRRFDVSGRLKRRIFFPKFWGACVVVTWFFAFFLRNWNYKIRDPLIATTKQFQKIKTFRMAKKWLLFRNVHFNATHAMLHKCIFEWACHVRVLLYLAF